MPTKRNLYRPFVPSNLPGPPFVIPAVIMAQNSTHRPENDECTSLQTSPSPKGAFSQATATTDAVMRTWRFLLARPTGELRRRCQRGSATFLCETCLGLGEEASAFLELFALCRYPRFSAQSTFPLNTDCSLFLPLVLADVCHLCELALLTNLSLPNCPRSPTTCLARLPHVCHSNTEPLPGGYQKRSRRLARSPINCLRPTWPQPASTHASTYSSSPRCCPL